MIKAVLITLLLSSCATQTIRPQTASLLDLTAATYATGCAIVSSELVNENPTRPRILTLTLFTSVATAFWASYIVGERIKVKK
jgi:hypothetical protein